MNNLLFVYRPRLESKCISEKQCEWGINVSPISACSLTKNCESMGADVAKNKPFNCIADRKADGGVSKTYKQLIHSGGRRHHRPSRHVSKKKCCNVSCLVQREKTLQRKKAEKYFCLFSSNKEGVPLQKICCDRHILPSVQDSNNGRY